MVDNEVTMARAALGVGAVLCLPVVGVTYLVRDFAGALTALGALALVIGQFFFTARSLAWAAKHGPTAVQATALGGFGLRLMIYAGLLIGLRPVQAIDGQVLAIVTAFSLVILLAWEVRLVMSHSEMWFIDADARPQERNTMFTTPMSGSIPGKDSA